MSTSLPALAPSGSPPVIEGVCPWIPSALRARYIGACAIFALYACATIALTWPLAAHLADGVTSAIDPVDSIWRLGWGQYQLLHHPLHLFDGNVFYPYPRTYLFDGLELGTAILTLPLAILALPPLVIYNVAVLLSLGLSGLGMHLLARRFGAPPVAAFVAGAIFAFAPMHLDRIGHIAFLSTAWFPLILLLLDRLITAPRPRDAVGLAACMIMQALSTQYYAIYLVFLVPLFLGVMLLRRPEARRRVVWVHLMAAGLVALAVVAPFALAYRQVQVQYGVDRSYGQVTYYSATLASFATADGRDLLWGHLTMPLRAFGTYTFERTMFPGLLALALAAVGLWRGRGRAWEQFLGALVLMSALLAIGPELRLTPDSKSLLLRHLPYDVLYWHVPGFDSMRAPGRFGVLFLLGIAGLAAAGTTALWHDLAASRMVRRPPARFVPIAASTLLLVCVGGEYASAPLKLVPLESGGAIPPVYHRLAAERDATVIELPLAVPDHPREQQIAAREQYFSLAHLHPLVNGNANVLPKGYKALVLEMQHFPSERSVAELQGLGITHVVIHLDELDRAHRDDMVRRLDNGWSGLSLIVADGETRTYRLGASDSFARLHGAIAPHASVVLSRADPQGTGAYMGMLGYVLRDTTLYAHLGVAYGEDYRGVPVAGGVYDYAILYRGEDPAALGISGAEIIWQDSESIAYRLAAPWPPTAHDG